MTDPPPFPDQVESDADAAALLLVMRWTYAIQVEGGPLGPPDDSDRSIPGLDTMSDAEWAEYVAAYDVDAARRSHERCVLKVAAFDRAISALTNRGWPNASTARYGEVPA